MDLGVVVVFFIIIIPYSFKRPCAAVLWGLIFGSLSKASLFEWTVKALGDCANACCSHVCDKYPFLINVSPMCLFSCMFFCCCCCFFKYRTFKLCNSGGQCKSLHECRNYERNITIEWRKSTTKHLLSRVIINTLSPVCLRMSWINDLTLNTHSNYRMRRSYTWWLLSMCLRTRLGHGQYLYLC